MNYDDKTDADINSMVSLLEGKEFIRENGLVYAGGMLYDPCNIPNDAWPIILDNGISLDAPLQNINKDWMARAGGWNARVLGENPLRAAMIVYLMMSEGKA